MNLDVGVALTPRTDGDAWGTPDDLFHAYGWEFAFTLDAACMAHNAKLPGFKACDGLEQDWTGQRVWCNPPYSDIEPWVAKASERKADVAAFLVPVRAGTDWWRRYVMTPGGGPLG